MSVAIETTRPARKAQKTHQRRARTDVAPAVYSVRTFCDANEISRSYLYYLWRENRGPRFYRQGKQKRITREAGAEWRAQMQAETDKAG